MTDETKEGFTSIYLSALSHLLVGVKRARGGYLPMRGRTVTVRYLSPVGLRRIDRRSTATVMVVMM